MNIRTGLLAGWIGLLLAGCTGTSRQAPARASAVPTVARYSVADLYKNTEFSGASFSADGTKILVSSNRSGIWNAFVIPTAGGEPTALTSSTWKIRVEVTWTDDGASATASENGVSNVFSHKMAAEIVRTTSEVL